ncbi:hypothetical protein YC2023_074005 [Brassica napus]
MGNFLAKEPPPPVVLVPPLFDFPPLSARNRMLEPSYNLLFGKLALKCLFEDYFEDARQFSAKFLLKPIDDPHVDLVASLSGALDRKAEGDLVGNALFRWQSDVDDPHTFVDLSVSTSNPEQLSDEYGIMGLRYGSTNLSLGATDEFPKSAWLVSKMGRLTVGKVGINNSIGDFVLDENKDTAKYSDLRNWSCAAGYGVGSRSPLSPSFNFGLELARSSQFIASFYQHVVVQRRVGLLQTSSFFVQHPLLIKSIDLEQVKNPFEEDEVVGITNYIDLGFELQTRVDDSKASDNLPDSSLQMAASWQANKNFLLKLTVNIISKSIRIFLVHEHVGIVFDAATTNHSTRETAYGFGLRVDNIREASYQRADPNFVMLTPNKEHLADGIVWKMGKRPMFQSDLDAENFSELPKELRPPQKIL